MGETRRFKTHAECEVPGAVRPWQTLDATSISFAMCQDLTSVTTFDRRGDPQEIFGDSRPSFSEWISTMREGLLYQTYHPQSEGDGGWQSHELQSWCW
jgi:hypothetical protein